MLAGQRWAVAIVVLAELLLLPTIWTRAFLPAQGLAIHLAALGAMIAIVPGVLAMRRAAAALSVGRAGSGPADERVPPHLHPRL